MKPASAVLMTFTWASISFFAGAFGATVTVICIFAVCLKQNGPKQLDDEKQPKKKPKKEPKTEPKPESKPTPKQGINVHFDNSCYGLSSDKAGQSQTGP